MCLKEGGYSLGNMAPSMEGKTTPGASAPLCSPPGTKPEPGPAPFCHSLHFVLIFTLFSEERGSVHNIKFTILKQLHFLLFVGLDMIKGAFSIPRLTIRCNKNDQTIPRLGKHQPAEIWGIWKRWGQTGGGRVITKIIHCWNKDTSTFSAAAVSR